MNNLKYIIKLLFIKKHIVLIALCLISILSKGDTNYQQRLASLKSAIPLTYSDATQYYIDWYINNPDSTAKIISLWNVYTPTIDNILKNNGQPTELKYLAFALSNMNNQSINKGASGIWQMLFSDAKTKYKLKINSLIDERRDIEKSTNAVAQYFKDLNLLYNDWYLSMTAYRATPNSVNKAIINAGVNMNYWSIYPFLSPEDREIVPRFVAAAYIANFYAQHHISANEYEFNLDCDTVKIEQQVTFESVAQTLNISIKQLQFLNPEYKTGVVPYSVNNYFLKIPKGTAGKFQELKYGIYTYSPLKPDNTNPIEQKKDTTSTQDANGEAKKTVRVAYKVKKGENLVMISDYFDCTVGMTKAWNGIRSRSNTVKAGRILFFMVKNEKKSYYEGINYMNAAQKNKIIRKD